MKKKYIYDFWYLKPRLNFNIPVIFDIFRKIIITFQHYYACSETFQMIFTDIYLYTFFLLLLYNTNVYFFIL